MELARWEAAVVVLRLHVRHACRTYRHARVTHSDPQWYSAVQALVANQARRRWSRPGAAPPSSWRAQQAPAAWHCASYRLNTAELLVNLVRPVFGFTVTKYSQFPLAGCSAASIAACPGLSIGPGGKPR